MAQMVGADIAELRDLAATFDSRAAALRSIESQMSWRINSAPWHGHDVSRFQHDWSSQHRRTITAAATSMTQAATELRAQADQQERASDAASAGLGSPRNSDTNPGKIAWDLLSIVVGGADVLIDLAKVKINEIPAQVSKFIEKNAKLIGAFKKLALGVAGIDVLIDAAEFADQVRRGNVSGAIVEGIDLVFDGVGFAGPIGGLVDTAYDALNLFKDNTSWGQAIDHWGADVGQAIWDWSVDAVVSVARFGSSDAGQKVIETASVLVDSVGGAIEQGPVVVKAVNSAVANVAGRVGDALDDGLDRLGDGVRLPSWLGL